MMPERMVSLLRAYVKANPNPLRGSHHIDIEDEVPEPVPDPFPEVLGYMEHRCVCGGATKRHASNWWCSNPAWHVSHPVPNEVDPVSEDDDLYDCALCTEVFYSETEPAQLALNGYPAVVCPACDRKEGDDE
jgi:hypothetical protein